MSDRIDKILDVLDNATQSSGEAGYALQAADICWRCDCRLDNNGPAELCTKCVEEMRAEKPSRPRSPLDDLLDAMSQLLEYEGPLVVGAFPDYAPPTMRSGTVTVFDRGVEIGQGESFVITTTIVIE